MGAVDFAVPRTNNIDEYGPAGASRQATGYFISNRIRYALRITAIILQSKVMDTRTWIVRP